jgi:N-acetylglucosaminyl-diphospho-decaprenol L-rhamnosyltransferase
MISYIIPTKDRHEELMQTLGEINRLGRQIGMGGAEVIVADNASATPVQLPDQLPCGTSVRTIRLDENIGASARNIAVQQADERCDWVIMLDDDSAPLDSGFEVAIRRAAPDVVAISADIFLGKNEDLISRREDGGLPDVFVGCGVAIRRDAYVDAGGYDDKFGFYAEEYDLSAKLLRSGKRIEFSPIFRVLHRKSNSGRDMNLIVERLVRNNGWTIQRYAPLGVLEAELDRSRERCRFIAEKESAMTGFKSGLAQLEQTIGAQRRTPMDDAMWERFTGLAAAREAIKARLPRGVSTAEIIAEGKNAHVVRRAMRDVGLTEVQSGGQARVIGTMSPGPMLDALENAGDGSPVIAPWLGAKRQSIFGDVSSGFAA